MPDSASQFVEVAVNPVLQQLTEHGICKDPVFRFTRAVINGYIHPALHGFTTENLQTARELVDFWLFPKEWATALAEEIAFHEWVEIDTEKLPPLLAAEADRIVDAYMDNPSWEISVDDIFTSNKSCYLDSFLGRCDLDVEPIVADDEELFETKEFLAAEEFFATAISNGHMDVVEMLPFTPNRHGCLIGC